MRSSECQISLPHTHALTGCSVGSVKQWKTPTEFQQCCALLMVMPCEVQSCSTQTPAAAALYSNGATRHQHAVSGSLLDSVSYSFCLCLFSAPLKLSQLLTPAASFRLSSVLFISFFLLFFSVLCVLLRRQIDVTLGHTSGGIKKMNAQNKVVRPTKSTS